MHNLRNFLLFVVFIVTHVFCVRPETTNDGVLLSQRKIIHMLENDQGLEENIAKRFRYFAREGWATSKKRHKNTEDLLTDKAYNIMMNDVFNRVIKMASTAKDTGDNINDNAKQADDATLSIRPPKDQYVRAIRALRNMGGDSAFIRNKQRTKPLLCAVFLSAVEADIKTLRNNIEISNKQRRKGFGCDWSVTFFSGDNKLIDTFLHDVTHAAISNDNIYLQQEHNRLSSSSVLSNVVHVTNYTGERGKDGVYVPKPHLYHSLLNVARPYQRLWVLDADLSLRDFSFQSLSSLYECTNWYDSNDNNNNDKKLSSDFPLSERRRHPSLPKGPLIAQPLIYGKSSFFKELTSKKWDVLQSSYKFKASENTTTINIDENNNIIGQRVGFIEQMLPIFTVDFYEWYMKYIVEPWLPAFLVFEATWGLDTTWCGAAGDFAYYSSYWGHDWKDIQGIPIRPSLRTNISNIPFGCGLLINKPISNKKTGTTINQSKSIDNNNAGLVVHHNMKQKGSQMKTKHGDALQYATFRFSGHMIKHWMHDYFKQLLIPNSKAFPAPDVSNIVTNNNVIENCV